MEQTLSQAGKNRSELEKVLRHYREHPEDSLKYQAACFLIDNMKWHLSTGQAVLPDSSLFEWHTRFDSLYTNIDGHNSRYRPVFRPPPGKIAGTSPMRPGN